MAAQSPLSADHREPDGASEPDGPELPARSLEEDDQHYRAAFERALRLLGQRDFSVRELVQRLESKGVDGATARLVVDDMRGRGLQSDQRFAEAFVHSRINRGHGPIRIRQELAQRGVDDDLADEVLTESGDYWLEQGDRARTKKFGSEPPEDRDDWNRQARFLARRGFPSDVIYRVLGRSD